VPPEEIERPDPETLELLSKQVDRYQAVVSRLAGNSLQVKTWSVTLAGALAAVAVNEDQPGIFIVAGVVLVAFGGLDAYYLSLERHFREASTRSVERARHASDWSSFFELEAPPDEDKIKLLRQSIGSPAIRAFYGLLAALLLVAGALFFTVF